MPPRLDVTDEAFRAAVKAAVEQEGRRDISQKAITFNIVTLITVLGAIISATAICVRKMDNIEHNEKTRWSVIQEQASWEQFADLNPDLKLKKPSIYAIHKEITNP